MISYTYNDMKKSKSRAPYLKNRESYVYFLESTQGEISISSKFQILKSHPDFEISIEFFACWPNFDEGTISTT